MKKLLAGALFLGIVASVYWFALRRDQETARDARAEAVLVDFDDRAVRRILLQRAESNGAFERVDGVWRLTEPVEDAANSSALAKVISSMQNAEVLETLEEPASLVEYGLDPPVVRFRLEFDGPPIDVGIGRPTPDGRGLFANRSDEDNVLIVDNLAQVLAVATVDSLRDPSLPGVSRSSVERLTFDLDGETGTFVREAGAWRLEEPFVLPARTAKLESLLDALYGARIVKYLDGVREASPDLFRREWSIELIGRAERTVEFGGSAGADRRYAIRGDRDTLMQVAFEGDAPRPSSLAELLADRWSEINRYQVREIHGRRPAGTYALTQADGNWAGERGELSEREVVGWLASFLATPVSGWERSASDGRESHDVRFVLESGDEVTFSWTPGRGGRSSEAPGARARFAADPPVPPAGW